MKYIMSLIIGLVLFSACGTTNFTTLDIRKGMPKAELEQVINNYSFFEFEGTMQNCTVDISKESGLEGKVEVILAIKKFDTERYFIFALRNDKLVYWGFPYEFNSSLNTEYNVIGKIASEHIKRIYQVEFEPPT